MTSHHVQKIMPDCYRLSWTFDTKINGSRLRWPRSMGCITNLAGAKRFAKKWGLPEPRD